MNTRPVYRLVSVFFAAVLTVGVLAGVDRLAQFEATAAHFAQQAPGVRA